MVFGFLCYSPSVFTARNRASFNVLFRILGFLFCFSLAWPAWGVSVRIKAGDIRLPGEYLTPVKPGMPAIVMLHGCGGLFTRNGEISGRMWRMGHLLQEMGYAVLYIDSFTPRGVKQVCASQNAQRKVSAKMRADDAAAAIRWLRRQKDVDDDRIGVLGWSHGADATLHLLGREIPSIRAAVTYYPACRQLLDRKDYRVSAPTLVLVGEADEWTPASDCKELARITGQDLFHVVTYPGIKHDFDAPANLPIASRDIANRARRSRESLSSPDSETAYDANRRTFKWFARWFDPERAIKGAPLSRHDP